MKKYCFRIWLIGTIILVVIICCSGFNSGFIKDVICSIEIHCGGVWRNADKNNGNFDKILYNDAQEWYERYNIVAHSGGEIDGHKYTNSMEAWIKSYNEGIRVFDADLNLTSDGVLVLRHAWSDDLGQNSISKCDVPTYSEFRNTLIFQKYTPMSVEDMFQFMKEHEDVYVACDFKEFDQNIIMELVRIAKEIGGDEVLQRVIISFYCYSDYETIKEIYPFDNWAIRQYAQEPHNYSELATFCVKNDIHVCMVGEYYIDEADDISVLTKCGIEVFAAVVNEKEKYDEYKMMGIKGVVSDSLTEENIQK